jgi:phage nucleotide-binding protein
MEVIRGKTLTAPKVMFYGLAGVGKSTLASKMSKPIFLDFEGGLNYMDVARTPQIQTLDEFYMDLGELYRKAEREYDTIVIDSADWLVRKVVEKAAGIDGKHLEETLNRSNGGYGNGKQVLENHIRTKLLPTLVALNKKGYGICLIAHAERKDMMDAEGVDVERISPKIDVNTMNVFVEWCDNVFYLKKNDEGERTLVLDSDNVALAKNRLGLSGEVKLSDIDINKLLTAKEK